MMLLAGEEDLMGASMGFERIWVACVVSRSRRKGVGEHGMVSPASSSSSSMSSCNVGRASEGVRGMGLECRTGKGEELPAMIKKRGRD